MVIASSTGEVYKNEMHYLLDMPTNEDVARSNAKKDYFRNHPDLIGYDVILPTDRKELAQLNANDRRFTASAKMQIDESKPSSHLVEANEGLNLTRQEADLYRRHLDNLWSDKGVDNPDGTRSSLLAATAQFGDKHYVIPTVKEGNILKPQEALKNATDEGVDIFPSYSSQDEAYNRYMQLHSFMELDTNDYENSKENKN